MINKPMLASKIKDPRSLKYPLIASPKLDGVRALTIDSVLVSRNWKPIPNTYIRNLFRSLPNDVDGELIGDDGTPAGVGFNATQSMVMSEDGQPDVIYHVFDYVKTSKGTPFKQRLMGLDGMVFLLPPDVRKYIRMVPQKLIRGSAELAIFERECLDAGYEGVMLRSPDGPYKEGRSTEKEGYLLKLKRFEDSEAIVLGYEELESNQNEAEEDAFGHTKRSHKKEGMILGGTLGKLCVRDIETGVEFEIGTGFTTEQRDYIWANRKKWMGKIVKYKYQACGMKERPRFPVYLGESREGKL